MLIKNNLISRLFAQGDLSDAVVNEQLQLVSQHLLTIYIGIVVTSLLMVVAVYGKVDQNILIVWICLLWSLTAVRYLITHHIHSPGEVFADIHRWKIFFIAGSGLSGLIWGGGGMLFLSTNDLFSVQFVLLLLCGTTAGTVASLSSYKLIYYAYAIPALLPAAIRFFYEAKDTYIALGVGTLAFMVINLLYSRNIHRMVEDSIRLRFEKIELVEKLAQQKLQAEMAQREAELANKMKSQFLAAASHDLRQPVHAMGLLIDAASSADDDIERAELFSKIVDSTDALRGLFDSLLDISKLDAGVVEVDMIDFDAQETFIRLEQEIGHLATQKKLQLSFECNDTVIRSDPLLLERVLRNLLSNAVKFTNSGGVVLRTRLDVDQIEICVTDTGPGIVDRDLDSIFSEFIQLQNPERDRRKGLGLGLAIVKRLCDLLGHSLTVNSAPPSGSTFCVRVQKGERRNLLLRTEAKPLPSWELENHRVLLIEDEEQIAAATKALLEGWGCTVCCAHSGDHALEILAVEAWIPDIILADYRLRGEMNGIEAIAAILGQVGKKIPSILITGDTGKNRLAEATGSGLRLLHKPVKPAELRMAINLTLMEAANLK